MSAAGVSNPLTASLTVFSRRPSARSIRDAADGEYRTTDTPRDPTETARYAEAVVDALGPAAAWVDVAKVASAIESTPTRFAAFAELLPRDHSDPTDEGPA